MRILVMLEAKNVSGSVKPVLEFAREARKASPPVELTVLTFVREPGENEMIRTLRAEGLPVETIHEKGPLDFRVLGRLRDAVRQYRPDLVWTNSLKSHFLTRVAGLHRQTRWVAFHHGYTATATRTRLYNEVDRWSPRAAHRVVTVCDYFARELQERGIDPSRLSVQHSPIRPASDPPAVSRREIRDRLGVGESTPLILTVGRLSREKGHADLISTMVRVRESIPAAVLAIVGEGPELATLQALCASLNLGGAVVFAGLQKDVRSYYAASDLFVLPSHSEGSPNVLLEAIEARLPVVATRVGGIPEMVVNDVTAILVEQQDESALAAAIVRLLQDDGQRSRLVQASQAVLARHSPDVYFRSLLSIFERVRSGG